MDDSHPLDPHAGQPAGLAPRPEPRAADEAEFLRALGARVRHLRALRGLSRKVLSRVSGLSERYIAQLESGQGNVSILLLRRVAAAIGCSVEELIAEPADADWPVFRTLLRQASPAAAARARHILAGTEAAVPGDRTGPERRRRIALIGLRGAGKSTLGRRLAAELGWRFVELNREIERDGGLSVQEVFAFYGQEGYRRLEQAALRRLVAEPEPMVLATGGGIVAEPLTFELVLASCFTVWLKAAPEEHMARVRAQGDLRPMADDRSAMQELRAILASREPLYARADVLVDTAGLTVEEAAERLAGVVRAEVAQA
jgi:XRE family transcriptional regulator, aerobic/anaerobic benzoate catabolism transcriptional regulator